jgi:hypothetical protein
MQKSGLKIVLAVVATAVFITGSARAGLLGSVVNVSAYFPNTSTIFEAGSNVTVSSAIEYPADSFLNYDRFAQIDITDNQVIIENTLNGPAPFNGGLFNGFVLTIISGPTISSAVVDPGSQANPVWIAVQNGNKLYVNFQGETVGAGASTIIDINLVPEPSTTVLLGLGFPFVLAFLRSKTRLNA